MKKFITSVLLLLVVICMSGCSLIYSKLKYDVKDMNGDDTSLAVFTDDDICDELPDNYCLNSIRESEGDSSYSDEDYEDFDMDTVTLMAKSSFSGVGVVQVTYGKSDTITFSVTSKLTEGNLRIVLFDYTNLTVLYDFEVGTTDSFTLTDASEGEYEVRVAGESAIFDITASRTFEYQD